MYKNLVSAICGCLCFVGGFVQTDTTGKLLNGIAPDQDVMLMLRGEVLYISDLEQVVLQDQIILGNGTLVHSDGFCKTKDLQKFYLLEGECLDQDGVLYSNEYNYRFRVEQENKGLELSRVPERNQQRYFVVLIKGQAFQIINKKQHLIQEPVDLGYGKFLNPNGVYRTSYGYSRLKEEGCITIYGKPLINLYEHRKAIRRKANRAKKKLLKKEAKI
tara:strand:- start:6176 stop:6826 length:651 start_codon:yes stop_codon:yes gene_type:complete